MKEVAALNWAGTGVDAASLRRYREDGVLLVRNVFSAEEAAAWKAEAERLFSLPGLIDPLNARVEARAHEQHGAIPDRLDPVLDISPVFARLVRNPVMRGIASSLIRSDAQAFRCKLIRKLPGTAGYSMHQDYPYWEFLGVPADDILTVAVAIDEATETSGGMEFFHGLHDKKQPADPEEPRDVDPACIDISRVLKPAVKAGDLIFFHSLTPHRSSPNRSANSRVLLLPTYASEAYGDLYHRYHEVYLPKKMRSHPISASLLKPIRDAEVAR